jgi:hypothetical protein
LTDYPILESSGLQIPGDNDDGNRLLRSRNEIRHNFTFHSLLSAVGEKARGAGVHYLQT